nr:ATP-binding protein [Streptomyces sp. CRN 30]
MATQQFTLPVPGLSTGATTVRRQAVAAIRAWKAGPADTDLDIAELLISELTTNALRHVDEGPVVLWVRLTERCLRIAVHDTSPVLPLPSCPDDDSETGRGLLLVTALATRHGAEPGIHGKWCWAEMTLQASTTSMETADPCKARSTPARRLRRTGG